MRPISNLLKKLWPASSKEMEQFLDPAFGHDAKDVLVLSKSEYGDDVIYLYPDEKQYSNWQINSPCSSNSTYEYQIEGTGVSQRLLDDWTQVESATTYHVKDNTVVESKLLIRSEPLPLGSKQISAAALERCRREVEWHNLDWPLVRYFILSRHPDALSDQLQRRRFFRQEIERIRLGLDALVKEGSTIGAELCEMSDGSYNLRFPGNKEISEEAEDALIELLTPDSLRRFNVSYADLSDGKRIARLFSDQLGEPVILAAAKAFAQAQG